MRMGAAEKWNLEVRRSGAELLVFSHMQMSSVLGIIADLMPVDPKSETAISETKMIERFLAVPPSSCRLMRPPRSAVAYTRSGFRHLGLYDDSKILERLCSL